MVLLPNIVFDLWRAQYNPTTGATAAEQVLTQNVVGHVYWNSEAGYRVLPSGGLSSSFLFYVDLSVGIRYGDIIKNIRLLDGITPWLASNTSDFWRVTYVEYSPPGIIPHVDVTVERITGGGLST